MSPPSLDSTLINVLRRVLAPVARLMLARGLTLPAAVELLKRIFVEVAEQDLKGDAKAVTDSRISLLTGVHRKDVRRLRELPHVDEGLPEKVSLGAQLIGQWTTQSAWVDDSGRPLALPRLAGKSAAPSFEGLVGSVSRDIRPRSVLDEWLRLGIVDIDLEDRVILREEAFIPRSGDEEKLAYYALNLGDHAAAATANVLGENPPWFERSVHHDGLSVEDVEAIRKRAGELGMKLLRDLHGQALAKPAAETGQGRRFTCGVYFYSADDAASGEPQA